MTGELTLGKTRNQILFWTLTTLLLVGFVWVFNDILLPFVLGIFIAYLLEPVVAKISSYNVPRWGAALIILAVFSLTVGGIFVIITPLIVNELQRLATEAPDLIERLWDITAPYTKWFQEKIGYTELDNIKTALQDNMGQAFKVGSNLFAGLISGGQAIVGFVTAVIVTPVVSFFMMKEWQNVERWADDLIPRDHYQTIKYLVSKMDQKLSGFIRGQFLVALSLGLIYATALTLAGLNYGFLIGLTAGLLSIIPLFGSTVGLVTSVIVAWFQSGEISYTAIVACIFFAGQFVEGNILSPRILGESVGLHPLWILFSVMAGGSLFGVVGMLLAVPVAAVISVLTHFAADCYRDSPLYQPSRVPTLKDKKALSEKEDES